MARLSTEHYRANASMTPDRKTSRLRGIFKSRSTTGSPSTADAAVKSPSGLSSMSPPTSPISPTVKPGFEKVGLLPSERESLVDLKSELEGHGGNRIAEVLEKQEEDLIDVGSARDLDAAEMNSDEETNFITQAFENRQDEGLYGLEEEMRFQDVASGTEDGRLHLMAVSVRKLISMRQTTNSVSELLELAISRGKSNRKATKP
jgi:hypothetical protein